MCIRCRGTCRKCGRPLLLDGTIYLPPPIGPDEASGLCIWCELENAGVSNLLQAL